MTTFDSNPMSTNSSFDARSLRLSSQAPENTIGITVRDIKKLLDSLPWNSYALQILDEVGKEYITKFPISTDRIESYIGIKGTKTLPGEQNKMCDKVYLEIVPMNIFVNLSFSGRERLQKDIRQRLDDALAKFDLKQRSFVPIRSSQL